MTGPHPGAASLQTHPASSRALFPTRAVGSTPGRATQREGPLTQGALGHKTTSPSPCTQRLGEGTGFHRIHLRAFKLIFNPSSLLGSFSH